LNTHFPNFIRGAFTFVTGLVCVFTFLIFDSTLKAQNQIASHSDYFDFISSIPSDHAGFIIVSDGRCGECLLVNDSAYLIKLDSNISSPIASVNSRSDVGIDVLMKHRVQELPTVLTLDQSGQLLRRTRHLPKDEDEIENLVAPFDTLPSSRTPLNFDLNYPEFLRKSFETQSQFQPNDELLSLYFQMNPNLQDEVVWTVALQFDLSQTIMNRIIAERDALIDRFGKTEVNGKLDEYFFSEMKKAARKNNESRLEEILAKAQLAFGKDEFQYTSKYRSYFYQLTGKWKAYLDLGNNVISRDTTSNQMLYEMALVILRYSNDKKILSEAANWFEGDLSEDNLNMADLKTILHWRAGEKTQAVELASTIEALPAYSPDTFPYTSAVLKERK